MNNLGDILGIANLVITLPVVMLVAWRLRQEHHKKPYLRVLRERFFVQRVLAWTVLVFTVIFLNNDAEVPPFDREATRVITRTVIFLAVLPSLYWLHLYRPRSR